MNIISTKRNENFDTKHVLQNKSIERNLPRYSWLTIHISKPIIQACVFTVKIWRVKMRK